MGPLRSLTTEKKFSGVEILSHGLLNLRDSLHRVGRMVIRVSHEVVTEPRPLFTARADVSEQVVLVSDRDGIRTKALCELDDRSDDGRALPDEVTSISAVSTDTAIEPPDRPQTNRGIARIQSGTTYMKRAHLFAVALR